jgi:hypothetical protein
MDGRYFKHYIELEIKTMRKIEKQMIKAIRERKNWKSGNTNVNVTSDGKMVDVFLHGNLIATVTDCPLIGEREVMLTSAGWRTNTTKSRLNAICYEFNLEPIYQLDYVWYQGEKQFTDGANFYVERCNRI